MGDQPWPWWQGAEHSTAEPDTTPNLADDGREEPQLSEPSAEADDDFSWAHEGPAADAPRRTRSGSGGAPSGQPWSTPAPGYGPAGYGASGYGAPGYGASGYGPPGYGPPGYGPPGYGPPRRRPGRSLVILAGVGGLIVAAIAGGLVGHALTDSHGSTSASSSSNPAPGGSNPGKGSGFGGGFPSSGGSATTPPTGSGSGPSDAAAIASRVDPGLVDINTSVDYGQAQAAGTGMVLTSNGEVLTNNHVVEGATLISVTDVGNGQTY